MVDSSALLAILLREPEKAVFERALADHEPAVSSGTVIETLRAMQLRRGPRSLDRVHRLLRDNRVEIEPVDADQIALAEQGMLRFGKGRGKAPAVLNFGDLFAYALAKPLDAPLLFKGDDFARTDVRSLGAASAGNGGTDPLDTP